LRFSEIQEIEIVIYLFDFSEVVKTGWYLRLGILLTSNTIKISQTIPNARFYWY